MALLTDDARRVIREQRLGFVATVCEDGSPNLSPKGTTTPWTTHGDDELIFADIRSPNTIHNLARDPRLEINVVDQTLRKGYRFKGTARILTEGPEFDEIVAYYRGELAGLDFTVQSPIRSIVVMTVTSARPLISPSYDRGTPEETVMEQWEPYWRQLWDHTRERLRARLLNTRG